jgi:glycosyltransferase involved in cell wall biosynthesis
MTPPSQPALAPGRDLAGLPDGGGAAGPRVALVHDWLTGMRGGEKVLEAIAALVPGAPIHTLVHVRGSVSAGLEAHPIVTAFTSRLPRAARFYRHFLPAYPVAVELFDLDGYDLVISTSHCAAKSVVRTGRARHLCYCHSPMRYAWDQFPWYFGRERLGPLSGVMRPIMQHLARWDASTSGRVDRYVANSQYVAARIRRYYNRESAVVYPPVDTGFFRPTGDPPGDYCLVVSALVPYKRLDLAIAACRLAGRPLRIVGTGPEEARLRQLAGTDVEFLGTRSDEELRTLYSMAYAVVLPGTEDFGIVPVEAQACGRPVVALNRGGAAETVVHEVTGLLVDTDTPDAFADALVRLGRLGLDPQAARSQALRFSPEIFREGFAREVDRLLAAPSAGGPVS